MGRIPASSWAFDCEGAFDVDKLSFHAISIAFGNMVPFQSMERSLKI